jgi:accessory colonization factor AcfC
VTNVISAPSSNPAEIFFYGGDGGPTRPKMKATAEKFSKTFSSDSF